MNGIKEAQDAEAFIYKRLKFTKGTEAGKPFTLAPWEKTVVYDVFGKLKPNGARQVETAYIEIPKKNGKSEFGAALALLGLVFEEESAAEVYSAASTRDQASIIFRTAAKMVRMDPVLSKMLRIIDSTKTIYLRDDPSSFYRAISADADIQDGMNPYFVIFDELHRQRNRDLWDVITFGFGARRNQLMVALTTAGVIGKSPICEEQHNYARRILDGTIKDPSYYPVIFGMPDKADWTHIGNDGKDGKPRSGWYGANPALGDFLSFERIKKEFDSAIELPTKQNSFRRFRLNQWVGQETRFIPMEYWNGPKCSAPFNPKMLAGAECFGGLDMSTTRDLTAFALIFPKDPLLYALVYIFVPGHELNERARRDRVPFDVWASQGSIHITPGNQVDYSYVRKTIHDCAKLYNIREVGYDRWNATQLVQELRDEGLEMVPIGQGFQSMNVPCSELLARVKGETFRHGGHEPIGWMADCMAVRQDPAGNIKPSKPDRATSSKRIDGMVAILNAMAREVVDEASQSIYNCDPEETFIGL